MARALFQRGKTGLRRDAQEPLSPAELVAVRGLLRAARKAGPVTLPEYLDSGEVARRLGLSRRTVCDLARAGEFDGSWGKALRPAHNRLRIPVPGVVAWAERRAFFAGGGEKASAGAGTGAEVGR